MQTTSAPPDTGFSSVQPSRAQAGFIVPAPAPDIFMGIRGSQGRRISLLRPDPTAFQPEDTARGLANENRYAGNYGPYSVAQHSVLVARVVEKVGGYPPQILAAVHHDDAEVVTGDIPTPIKRTMRLTSPAFDDMVARLDHALEVRYSIDLADPVIGWADKVVFNWEVKRLVPEDARWIYLADSKRVDDKGLVLPYTWFVPWSPSEAFARYMDTHERATMAIEGHVVTKEFADNAS